MSLPSWKQISQTPFFQFSRFPTSVIKYFFLTTNDRTTLYLGMLKVVESTSRTSKVLWLLEDATTRFKPYTDFAAGHGPKPVDFTTAVRHVTALSTGISI